MSSGACCVGSLLLFLISLICFKWSLAIYLFCPCVSLLLLYYFFVWFDLYTMEFCRLVYCFILLGCVQFVCSGLWCSLSCVLCYIGFFVLTSFTGSCVFICSKVYRFLYRLIWSYGLFIHYYSFVMLI